MAEKELWFGSVGPFLYDSDDTYEDGVGMRGVRADKVYLDEEPTAENEAAKFGTTSTGFSSVDSKVLSNSLNISIADSKAESVAGGVGSGSVDSIARSMTLSAVVIGSSAKSDADSKNLSQSTLISVAYSKAESAATLGGTDSVARSKADSAGSQASIADSGSGSYAVSLSTDISVVESKTLSQSVLLSEAGSRNTSQSVLVSVADSKAVSAASAGGTDSEARSSVSSLAADLDNVESAADSKNTSQSVLISVADSKGESAASIGATDSVARSKADSAGTVASVADSEADSKNVSQSTLISVADSKAVSAASGGGLSDVVSDTTPQLGGFLDINGKYVNYPGSLGSDHTYEGDTIQRAVGESVVFGDALYFDWTDKEYKKADADASGTMPISVIALESKGDGDTCLLLKRGWIRDDSWSFAARDVWASASTGGFTTTQPSDSGDQVQWCGEARASSIMWFEPSAVVVELS